MKNIIKKTLLFIIGSILIGSFSLWANKKALEWVIDNYQVNCKVVK